MMLMNNTEGMCLSLVRPPWGRMSSWWPWQRDVVWGRWLGHCPIYHVFARCGQFVRISVGVCLGRDSSQVGVRCTVHHGEADHAADYPSVYFWLCFHNFYFWLCLPSTMQQCYDLELNPFSNSSLHYTFRPTRPSSGALKFRRIAVPSALLRSVFSYL
jgi:hypothetical protein